MDDTFKQRSYEGTSFHYSILIEIEKFTTHQDLFFFPFEGKLTYQAFIFFAWKSIDVNFFNFFPFSRL